MRSDREVSREALRRAENIRERKAEIKRRVYGACGAAACLALVLAISFFIPSVENGAAIPGGLYGASLFADSSVGGYALIGVIGFVLGAAVVIIYKRSK